MSKRNWNFKQKNIARVEALKQGTKEFSNGVKTALFFPSNTCLDLYEAHKIGLIDENTFLVLVEKDKNFIKDIKSHLKKLGYKRSSFYIHNGEIEEIELNTILNDRKIEYMFFDICGNLTPQIANWLYFNQEYFADDMVVPFTLQIAPRGCRVKRKGRKGKNEPTAFMWAVNKNTQRNNYSFPENNNIIESYGYIKSDNLLRDITFALKTIYHVFSERKIDINKVHIYRDLENKSPLNMMVLYAQLNGKKNKDVMWKKIGKDYNSKVCSAKRIKIDNNVNGVKKKGIEMVKSIAEELNIYSFRSYNSIPPAKKAWITMKARERNCDPKMVHAGIKATFSKMKNKKKKKK